MKRSLFAYLAIAVVFLASALALDAQQPQSSTAPDFATNSRYVQGASAGGYRPTSGSGLALNIGPGTAWCNGTIVTYAGGALTMTANTTNYVYLNSASSCVPAVSTSAFSSSVIPIATVTASGSAITTISDDRTMMLTGSGGGTPGGSSGQIQFNFSGAFAGIAGSLVHSAGDVKLQPTGANIPLTVSTASSSSTVSIEGDDIKTKSGTDDIGVTGLSEQTDNSGMGANLEGVLADAALLGSNTAGDNAYALRVTATDAGASGGAAGEVAGIFILGTQCRVVDVNCYGIDIGFTNAPAGTKNASLNIQARGDGNPAIQTSTSDPSILGTVSAASVSLNATTVGALPSAASNAGKMFRVSDSTSISAEGQMCAGGSSNVALAFSNGSIWKCF